MNRSNQAILERRVKAVAQVLPGQREPLFAAVYCTSCGKIEGASNADLLAPKIKDWLLSTNEFEGQDYCPDCIVERA